MPPAIVGGKRVSSGPDRTCPLFVANFLAGSPTIFQFSPGPREGGPSRAREQARRGSLPCASMTDEHAPEDETSLDYARLYEFRFRDVEQRRRQAVWNDVAPFVWRRMGSPRRVLDPAGGLGEFVNAVPADERWLVDVVDFEGRATAPDVRVVIGNVFDVELPQHYFDGVFASNL